MLLLTVLLCLGWSLLSGADQPIGNKYSATPVDLQLPPTLAGRRNSIWHAPPYGWIFGNWKVTYSSQPTYQDLYNFQIDWSPVLPYDAGKRNRLTSYQTQNASRILTTFGYDIPDPIDPNSVADFFPTGPLGPLNNSDEIIAWGYDTDGLSYLVVYETAVVAEPAPPGIDVFSRSETGPSNVTLQAIIQGFLDLRNDDLGFMAKNVTKIPLDARRTGLPPVACDAACLNNTQWAGSL